MSKLLEKIRNIGVMAHIDAGKTTITERILYYTDKTYKMGEVHEGTAVMDYMEEEQERGITIMSAATTCPWGSHNINLIDTPGHIDFTAEVERSLRVLDGAVAAFDASEGVQAQSETVWRQGMKYDLSIICFINKMDKVGADFYMAVDSIRDKLLATPILIQIPIGSADTFEGIIDLVKMKALFYDVEELGKSYHEEEIPDKYKAEAAEKRAEMISLAAEFDEELMDKFVHDEPISEQMIDRAIRRGTIECKLNPVFCGSALRYIGVQRLMDGIVAYLPSPLERPIIYGHKPKDDKQQIEIKCDPSKPLVGLVFKITSDVHGDLNYVRLYQGTLKGGSRVLDATRNRRENITRLYEMHAEDRQIIEQAHAGDIVAVVGLKQTLTGDTICDTKHPIVLPSITFPETVISMSIEPASSAEKQKLADALGKLRREDPTFGCQYENETGQTIISGMGELHLEVLQHKLVRDMGVNVRVGKPRVAYKEAIMATAESEGKFVRQTGGRGQYGHVVLRVEPKYTEDGHWEREIEFVNEVIGGAVPKEYIGPVERGVKDGLSSGALMGYPMVGVKVALIDGSSHPVDSSELAFEQAGAIGVQNAIKKAEPVLLEPVMRLQVVVPEEYYGAVQSSLMAKRGLITDSKHHGNVLVIDAKVPLAEMFGYSNEIRGLTAGRGTFTMEPLSYEKVPEQVANEILV